VAVSVFDLFKIGIGPSSSHTVGPMRAARLFVERLRRDGLLARTARVHAALYGSLGATGKGHGSDKAVLLGLAGHEPETVDVETIPALLATMRSERAVWLGATQRIAFDEKTDLTFHRRQSLPLHANGMQLRALDGDGVLLTSRVYYSVGGGFVISEEAAADGATLATIAPDTTVLPHPFHNAADLLRQCSQTGLTIAQLMRENERHWRSDAEIDARLLQLWQVMQECVARGCRSEGTLPGGFKVRRRAAALHRSLLAHPEAALKDPLQVLDWVNLYALAVNEENAAGGRVVTAPTNGAAGIVPAVLHYYSRFIAGANDAGVIDLLLTAGAIGILYKENASISGAEVGCQGEVGVACSMAAGGARWQPGTGRKRRRDRHGASPRTDLRSGRRAGADPVHRAQCHRVGAGDQRGAHGAARRRHALREPGQGDQDDARNRRRHADQVQGNSARRAGGQHRRVLIGGGRGSSRDRPPRPACPEQDQQACGDGDIRECASVNVSLIC
jgi:L-serine dehydratase